MQIPADVKTIIEPFTGNGNLLKFITNSNERTLELYDIDPKYPGTVKRDTLKNPPDYTGKFVLTNPPYLARNKNKNKELYDLYKCNDLYKCFITSLVDSAATGGIIIVPLNFISSMRKADVELRKKFLKSYRIQTLNIFEERVFDDTSYAVCSIYFTKNTGASETPNIIDACVYPSKKKMAIELSESNNYTIGGELYALPSDPAHKVQRATKKSQVGITNILLKCIDDSAHSQLGFKIVSDADRYIDNTAKLSARSYATLLINKSLTLEEQKQLVDDMNTYLREQRKKYNSLFLSNYRDNNSIARKRISFKLAFGICSYMLTQRWPTSRKTSQ